MTIVFVTHSVSEAAFLANRAVVLGSKPARVILDRPNVLPLDRGASVRTSEAFIREVDVLLRAFGEADA